MTAETDAEFVERVALVFEHEGYVADIDWPILFALARRGAAMMPRPIEEAPKDREVIGVERPPGEDRNFYRMVKWDDDKNAWVTQVDIDWSVSPGRVVYAVCHGVSHFIHPDAVPLIPEEIVEASDNEDPECTDCLGTGVTLQTERRCSCQPPPPAGEPSDE